jgi:putative ABC transport system permease protein
MKIQDALKTSITGLKHAKTRSALTMLGIVIGISSVILLMSIGTSAQRMIIDQVEGIGSNLIFVIPGGTPKNSKSASPASVLGIVIKTLNERDIEAFKREPSISKAAADNAGRTRVIYGNNDISVTYYGVTGDYFSIVNIDVDKGNLITKNDDESLNKVAVLGPEIAKTLFGNVNPVGKSIRMKGLPFKVVGVIQEEGLGVFGADLNNMIFIPMSVSQKQMLGTNYYSSVVVEAKSEYTIDFVKSRMTSILRQNHNITDPDKDDFTIRTQEDVLSILGTITSVLKIFLTSIAAISLIVGGIGIMNIMLVSVIERTREIGLRKALGATNSDIMQQFLTEAIIVTSIGGIIGILFGAALTAIAYVGISYAIDGWVFALPFSAIALGLLVAFGTGLIFGIYPARQAAKKNPIEALRYE